MRFALHNHFSGMGWSPGFEADVVDRPVGSHLSVDAGLSLWLQPSDLRWDATTRTPGGRIHGEMAWLATDRMDLWLGVAAKSTGWVLGEVYLNPNVSGQVGLTTHLR